MKRRRATPAEAVGSSVRKMRMKKGLSQRQLAAKLEMGHTDICKLEKGQASILGPHVGVLYDIAEVLGEPASKLVPPLDR